MEIGERIEQLIKTLNLTGQKFAESIGVNSSNITHIISNRSKPGYQFLHSILREYPQISGDWLISGDGEMLKNTIREVESLNNIEVNENIFNFSAFEQEKSAQNEQNGISDNSREPLNSMQNPPDLNINAKTVPISSNYNSNLPPVEHQGIDNINSSANPSNYEHNNFESSQVGSNAQTNSNIPLFGANLVNNNIQSDDNANRANEQSIPAQLMNVNSNIVDDSCVTPELPQPPKQADLTSPKREISRIFILYNDNSFEEIGK